LIPDHTVVGNELKEAKDVTDFTVEEDNDGEVKKRRAPRRKSDDSTD
jgi:hypothetical protein